MRIEQYVMAYGVEQDRLRAILPAGFGSLRPVLRFNAEIRDDESVYIEFNTAVEKDGKRGWINIGCWDDVRFEREGKKTTFRNENLEISFKAVGIEGSCPAEKDNEGCFFIGEKEEFRPAEQISVNKEFCDCEFRWLIEDGTFGKALEKLYLHTMKKSIILMQKCLLQLRMQRLFLADRYWALTL